MPALWTLYLTLFIKTNLRADNQLVAQLRRVLWRWIVDALVFKIRVIPDRAVGADLVIHIFKVSATDLALTSDSFPDA